jgi:hypothetical protein
MAELQEWGDQEWNNLLLSIKLKQCAPFIGSGAAVPALPTGKSLAREWAAAHGYPFADSDNLQRVAQYIAVQEGGNVPKLKIIERFKAARMPDFRDPTEPHRAMAELGLPLYITTNYDDFMYRALQQVIPPEKVKRDLCLWHRAGEPKAPRSKVQRGAPDSPLVFHLHGTLDVPDSIVITEDDYLDFLMYISEIQTLIPTQVRDAFRMSSLLFLGYSLDDTDFKLILRRMASYLHRGEGPRHIAVQLAPEAIGKPPTDVEIAEVQKQQSYLHKHYGLQKVRVFWGTCRDFATKLMDRWKVYPK